MNNQNSQRNNTQEFTSKLTIDKKKNCACDHGCGCGRGCACSVRVRVDVSANLNMNDMWACEYVWV